MVFFSESDRMKSAINMHINVDIVFDLMERMSNNHKFGGQLTRRVNPNPKCT